MENELEKNSENQNYIENKLIEYKHLLDKFSNISKLILDENDNPTRKTFITALILEFFDLEEKILDFNIKHSPNDDIVSLSFAQTLLITNNLDTKFSKYRNYLDEIILNRLFQDAFEYWKQHETCEKIIFCNHPIINLCLNLKIKVFKQNLNEYVNMGLLVNGSSITDKSKLVYKVINHLIIGLKPEKILNPLNNLTISNYKFCVSKPAANTYIYEKIEILNDALKDWGLPTVNIKIHSDYAYDFRIDTGLHYQKIMDYFMKLNVTNKSNKSLILSEKDIKTLVDSNFVSHNAPTEKVLLQANIRKSDLKRFVYEFSKDYDKNDYQGKQKLYLNFLIDNFSLFNGETTTSLSPHFAFKRGKNYYL